MKRKITLFSIILCICLFAGCKPATEVPTTSQNSHIITEFFYSFSVKANTVAIIPINFFAQHQKKFGRALKDYFYQQKIDQYAYFGTGVNVLDVCMGDIGNDGNTDVAIVVEYPAYESETGEYKEREFFVFVNIEANGFTDPLRNSYVIYADMAGGMNPEPYGGMSLENGQLTVSNYGGSGWHWSYEYTFTVKDDQFVFYSLRDNIFSFNGMEDEYLLGADYIYYPLDGTMIQTLTYFVNSTETSFETEDVVETFYFEPMIIPLEEFDTQTYFKLQDAVKE